MSEPVIPFADCIGGADEQADIYSMFRMRRGFAGHCRRVRRASDDRMLDVGFLSNGAYDIQRELAWAGDSEVFLVRWYNQSAAAGDDRPEYLHTPISPSAPRTCCGGQVISVGRWPAIELRSESSLSSTPVIRVSHDGAITVVWLGVAMSSGGFDSGLWSVHEEGIDDARTCEVDARDRSLIRDRGCYYERASLYSHPSGDFSKPSLIVVAHQVNAPWQTSAWVNGVERGVGYQGAVGGVGVGAPLLLGPNRVHTYIVDGSAESAIAGMAMRCFDGGGWIG